MREEIPSVVLDLSSVKGRFLEWLDSILKDAGIRPGEKS